MLPEESNIFSCANNKQESIRLQDEKYFKEIVICLVIFYFHSINFYRFNKNLIYITIITGNVYS